MYIVRTMSQATDRALQFHLLLSEDERENLKTMADAFGLTQSDYVRHLLGWQLEENGHLLKNSAGRERLRDIGMLRKAKLARWDADRMERRVADLDPETSAAIGKIRADRAAKRR